MNDQHPHAGYDAYATGSFGTDPFFGTTPGGHEGGHPAHADRYDAGQWPAGSPAGHDAYGDPRHAYGRQYGAPHFDTAQYRTTAQYDSALDGAGGQWDANAGSGTGQFTAEPFETGAQPCDTGGRWTATGQASATSYETGAHDAAPWNPADATATATDLPYGGHAGQPPGAELPGYAAYEDAHDRAGAFIPGQFSPATGFDASQETRPGSGTAWEAEAGPGTGTWTETAGTTAGTTGTADGTRTETGTAIWSTTWSESWTGTGTASTTGTAGEHPQYPGQQHEPEPPAADAEGADRFPRHGSGAELIADAATVSAPAVTLASADPARPARRTGGARGRRRTPAKRSALLTVAVPSVCVMGVAGVAAASVGGLTEGDRPGDGNTAVTAADQPSVQPVVANNALDTQLAALSADARDFGDRASRTQERIDLKARQEAERKKREEEAALREKLRPKFALPVAQHGLSAYFGQAGVNWMSMHTGIDFPVSYGTPVMAATDGTVRTQWNSAYGNMAIVTAADGTETWYCHLSSTKIRSGQVKAGEVIAYSGNSGNSTGPHLHFEVRPGGGVAIDPLAWLRSHALSPT
ncbi:M23 family metallopeptidase [Streptomyces pacificus]|uniref:M23 family metallopeptidase n=1 Tax=Streptomyces pacificus TaxID=2705029 RepID=A0A6A0AUQ0_9ACTN|nr:M23 family metallopeptidase [Streptomyces pacificus]GFH36081.1 M23 family metallopeptidase [Streptomyces pacificus]